MNNEQVGFILSDGEIVEVPNISPSPGNSFQVAADVLIEYEHRIIATWHTHPGKRATLSGEDYIGFQMWPDCLHIIIGKDGLRGYVVHEDKVLNDASKNHPAWAFSENLAEWLRVRGIDPDGGGERIRHHEQNQVQGVQPPMADQSEGPGESGLSAVSVDRT